VSEDSEIILGTVCNWARPSQFSEEAMANYCETFVFMSFFIFAKASAMLWQFCRPSRSRYSWTCVPNISQCLPKTSQKESAGTWQSLNDRQSIPTYPTFLLKTAAVARDLKAVRPLMEGKSNPPATSRPVCIACSRSIVIGNIKGISNDKKLVKFPIFQQNIVRGWLLESDTS
jgi:hypothetical protein